MSGLPIDCDVLYVGFLLGHGGDAVQMLELAAGMSARGVRVRVVVPELDTSVELAERGRLIGVEVIRSPLVRSDPVSSRQNLPSLLELFRTWRAPIVHMHT